MPPTTHATTTTDDEPAHDRRRAKARYERLLAVVEQQTGGPDAPDRAGVRRCNVQLTHAAHGRYDEQEVRRSIRAALENDALLEYTDEDNVQRLARRTEGGLLAVLEANQQRELLDDDRAAEIARAYQEVRNVE